MKKLVTAFALCAAISAMAVESQNVVGYQTKTLAAGAFTHLTPTFITVGSSVAQITFAELKGSFGEGDSLQTTDENFSTASEYFYLVEGSGAPGATGWYADDFETPVGTMAIPAGSSLLYSATGSASFTSVGQVNSADVQVVTAAGFNSVGNPFPIDITLADIGVLNIAEGNSIQFVDGIAATASEFFYLVAGSGAPGATGWYADDFETPAGATALPAGMGFLFNELGSGTTLTFSTPL